MPLMSGSVARRVSRAAWALVPSQSVGSSKTVIPGNFVVMHSLNASERSRPLIDDSAPWNSTTLPVPPSCSPRNSHALVP